jgi:hypothetical protein
MRLTSVHKVKTSSSRIAWEQFGHPRITTRAGYIARWEGDGTDCRAAYYETLSGLLTAIRQTK